MFGLKTPIALSEKTDEFDSVSTILSQSSVARPSRAKRAPPWMSSIDDDGGVFHLELPPGVEVTLVKQSSIDGNSVSSFAIGAGCNSEDTGYASDQDPWGGDHQRSSNGKKNKNKCNGVRSKHSDIGISEHGIGYEKGVLGNKTVTSYDKGSIQRHVLDQHFGNNGQEKKGFSSNHSVTSSEKDDEIDDGIFLNKSELRASTGSSVSYSSKRSDSSGGTEKSSKSGCQILKNNVLINRFKKLHEWKSAHVELSLCTKFQKSNSRSGLSHRSATPCEDILGIVPGKSDSLDVGPKPHGHQIFVKALTPGGPAVVRSEIVVGSWLYSVNGQTITWDNMKSILTSVAKLKKVRLTLKSLRSDKSTLDLEGLVSVLSSDAHDPLTLTNVAALYISMDGVDPDSPQNNDGVVYSYPQGRQALLYSLQGLFYTLAHVVKDLSRSSTIRNSTIEVEGQCVHIAYLQEGSDILVFAMPASCVSLSELNTLLSGFSRLLWILYGTIQTAFSKGENSVFIDNILTYLFRQTVSASNNHPTTTLSSSSSLSTSFSSSSLLKEKSTTSTSESIPFIRYSKHIQYLPLPREHQMVVERTLNEFESSDFHDMSESFYGCRRQFTILGTSYFYCGQLVVSHQAPHDLHDLHIYLQHLGVLELTKRCSVSQFVAWKEVFPTRFCHEISEINNSFGYSEPMSRWCFLVIGVNHGLFCCLLETVGSRSFKKSTLSPDVFYIDQAKGCLLRIQSPSLMAALNLRVNKETQSAFTKSDYCATYINTTGGKNTRLFSNEGGQMKSRHSNLIAALGSEWSMNDDLESSNSSVSSFDLYKSTHSSKMYPVQCDSYNIPLNISLSDVAPVHRLSSTKHPSLYQYFCLDGMEGTICTGSDMDSSGLFHSHILHGFYKCCRQIHNVFSEIEGLQNFSACQSDDDELYDPLISDSNLKGMKEHGILMSFTPHQGMEASSKDGSILEYWVVGRKLKRPHKKILLACFHVSASENLVELAFRYSFGC